MYVRVGGVSGSEISILLHVALALSFATNNYIKNEIGRAMTQIHPGFGFVHTYMYIFGSPHNLHVSTEMGRKSTRK